MKDLVWDVNATMVRALMTGNGCIHVRYVVLTLWLYDLPVLPVPALTIAAQVVASSRPSPIVLQTIDSSDALRLIVAQVPHGTCVVRQALMHDTF